MNATARTRGFTVIELIFVIAVLAVGSVIFFIQKNDLTVSARDETRKTAINAMYYSLEKVYFKENGFYPRTIDAATLPSVDPVLFTDPSDAPIGDSDSEYRYEALNCTDNQCKSYTLRTTLENEDDFVKRSNNN